MRRVMVGLLALSLSACGEDGTGPAAGTPSFGAGGPPIKTQQCSVAPLSANFALNDQLYVANRTNIITGHTGLTTTGGAYLTGAPDTTIGGSNTQLSLVSKNYLVGMVRDRAGRFYVAGPNTNTVTVYPRPTARQNNTPPIGSLSAANGLSQPGGLALDTLHNLLYVANTGNGTVIVYAVVEAGANVTFQPWDTLRGLSAPLGLALNSDGTRLYVANKGSNSIGFYRVDPGAPFTATAVPLATPLKDLTGPIGITLNPAGTRLYVANNGKINNSYSVTIYGIDAGSGMPAPAAVHIGGDKTGLCNPATVAVGQDPSGSWHLFVANRESSGGSISVYNLNADGSLNAPAEFNVQPAAYILHDAQNQLGAPVGLTISSP